MPGVDEGDAVAEPFGLLHEVRHQHDRHPAVAHALDEVPGVPAGLRVEPGRHLVEHRDLRLADEGQHDGQALSLAAGQGPVVVLALAFQPEHLDQLGDVSGLAVEGLVHVQDLADPELGRKGALLELHPDDLVDLVPVGLRVQAHQPDCSRVRRAEADRALDRGGLARSVRAEDAEDLAFGDRERDVVDRDQRSVRLAEMLDLHRLLARCLVQLTRGGRAVGCFGSDQGVHDDPFG